jgi:DNA-binding MarR family transcriptional regulator
VQATTTATAKKPKGGTDERSAELRQTAARLGAFLRHVFLFSGGEHLQKMEETGLSLTQCKVLLMLAGPEGEEPYAARDIAQKLRISLASVSRAVDGLARSRLIKRVEDPDDRRVRRLSITSKGERLAGEIVAARLADLEAFAESLTPAQRRRLDAALEAVLDEEAITAAAKELEEIRS